MTSAPFFDTSVLLAGLIDLGPSSIPAQQLMTAVANGKLRRVHTAWHCCLEFYAVATRLPEELRLHPTDAWRLIDEELLARFAVHQLAADQQRSFLAGVAEERIAGGRVYDAHIAEIARRWETLFEEAAAAKGPDDRAGIAPALSQITRIAAGRAHRRLRSR